MSPSPSSSVSSSVLADRTLHRHIAAVLRWKGVRPAEIPDLVQDTLVRVLRLLASSAHAPPPESWQAFATVVARGLAVDATRRRCRRSGDVGPCEDADAYEVHEAWSMDDRRDAEEVIQRFADDVRRGDLPPFAMAVMVAISQGVPQEDIAEELGLGYQALRYQLSRIRRKFAAMEAERAGRPPMGRASPRKATSPRAVFRRTPPHSRPKAA